jgi:hypothetical protein
MIARERVAIFRVRRPSRSTAVVIDVLLLQNLTINTFCFLAGSLALLYALSYRIGVPLGALGNLAWEYVAWASAIPTESLKT